jgi:hypothetical protein
MAAKKVKAKAKPKMSFNERVKSVIRGEAETKEKVVNIFNQSAIQGVGLDATVVPANGLTQTNILDVLSITQGSEQEEREGNKIQDCRLRLRGFIQSQTYSATNSSEYPYEVHMVFFKEKKSILNDNSQLKQLPNNNTGIVDGTVLNSLYPYNKDKYIIRKVRVFKMRPLAHTIGGTAVVNGQQSNASAYKRFVETIDIHKELKYNDQSNVPANDWLGVSFFVINGDNTALANTQIRALCSMDAVLRYKDL